MCLKPSASSSSSSSSRGTATDATASNNDNAHQLPVIIAGAGPCGLTAALNLEKHGIPYCMYERASREKLCSNAGSGIDMAPSAVDILENKLRIDMDKAMRPYEYMVLNDMTGQHVKTYRFMDLKINETRQFGFANRSDLQNALLDKIMAKKETPEEQDQVLKCGTTVTSYENHDDHVQVMLSDGTSVKGSALLACDGIHSAVRKHMHRNVQDDLSYCGQECWWGKTTIKPGSELDQELQRMAKEGKIEDGSMSIVILGTPKYPGGFFSCEVAENIHAWVYFVKNKRPAQANQTNDLVRRGGRILSEEDKRTELEDAIADRSKLLQLIVRNTPAADITKAGLFDRENLDLPFVDGRVALLGDAAHPQSPMMGQGANMAIVDGYVVTTRFAAAEMNNVAQALEDYDTKSRREGIKKVIKSARFYGNASVSKSRWKCWLSKSIVKYSPPSMVMSQMVKGDVTNLDFIEAMEKDIKTNMKE